MAQVPVQAVVGVLPDRAGVEHDDVRLVAGRGHVPRVVEQARDALESCTFIWQPYVMTRYVRV